jgi:hypothetical protein
MSAPVQLLGLHNGQLVPVAVDADGKVLIGATIDAQISDIEIANDSGNPVPVLGPLTDTQLRAAAVPTKTAGAAATATISRVAASAASVSLLAANENRRRVILYNESTADLYVKFGATASATSYTTKLGPGDTYESPTDWVYTGVIDGIWSAANGAAQITEL